MADKIRVAVISAGMIANAAHIPAYRHLADRVELVAVSDTNPVSAQQTAERHGIPNWYTDTEQMLREQKPDLVSVCTPNRFHKENTMLALSYGCNVACEKPLALTYADTKEMFDYAGKQGKMLIACQTLRYDRQFSVAREFYDNGELGRIYYSEFSCIRRRGIPKWGTFHKKEMNGGGALCDLGVHLLDAILWIQGCPKFESITGASSACLARKEKDIITSLAESGAPSGVFNARPYAPEEFNVEEFAAGSIRLEGGQFMNFKTSWAVNLPPEFRMNICGDKAGYLVADNKILSTMGRYQVDIEPKIFDEDPLKDEPFSGHFYLMENIVDHLQHDAELFIKPEETLNVAKIIDAFYISAAEGREVKASEFD